MKFFRKAKKREKKRKYDTDVTIGGIIRIRHEDPCMVYIHGEDPEWLTAEVSTTFGAFYTIKIKQEKKNEAKKNINGGMFNALST